LEIKKKKKKREKLNVFRCGPLSSSRTQGEGEKGKKEGGKVKGEKKRLDCLDKKNTHHLSLPSLRG